MLVILPLKSVREEALGPKSITKNLFPWVFQNELGANGISNRITFKIINKIFQLIEGSILFALSYLSQFNTQPVCSIYDGREPVLYPVP